MLDLNETGADVFMSIELLQQIAFRLTRVSVIAAFMLGILISVIQVLIDLDEQRSLIDQTAIEIFDVARESATRTAYQLDLDYAEELIEGLQSYQLLNSARLIDDRDNVMASFQTELSTGPFAGLTQRIVGDTKMYRFELKRDTDEVTGYMELVVDNREALLPFFNRAGYIFVAGLLRNLALAGVLLIVFHLLVTRPLVNLAVQLGEINAVNPNQKRLSTSPRHQRSEIGYIVETVNQFIDASEDYLVDLANLEKQLRLIINTVPLMIYAVDDNKKVLMANATTSLFYRLSDNDLVGQSIESIHNQADDKEATYLVGEIDSAFISDQKHELNDLVMTKHDGSKVHYEVAFIPFHYFNQKSVLLVFNDISERIASQKAIEKLAYHDALTGLPNRTLFQDRLRMDIRRAERFGHYGALLFVDLDKFKMINDTLGHAMGDQMLIDVSNKIRKRIRDFDTFARMGGDEFAVSLSDLGSTYEEAIENGSVIANEINDILSRDVSLAGHGYQISASIGLVTYPNTANEVNSLLRFADAAMYQAKHGGRHQVKVFEQAMIDQVTKQFKVEKEILNAIEQNEFEIFIQPLFSVHRTKPVSAEVLIRWQHPERGIVGPNEFLGYLESLNLMHHISNVAIEQTSRLIKTLNTDALKADDFRFGINISTLEFYEPDFTQRIRSAIEDSGVPLELFELEITEGIALHDLQLAKAKLLELESFGLTLALDDFGTGYSSLSYLKNLDVHKLKVDKSFIDGIEADLQDQKLVDSIIKIAQNFDLSVVIEGVETEKQLDWLKNYDNLVFQGYFFGKPMSTDDFIAFMNERYL